MEVFPPESDVQGIVNATIADYAPGALLALATRSTQEVINNSSGGAVSASVGFQSVATAHLIEGLELSFTGTGRYVTPFFMCTAVKHATVNTGVMVHLVTSVDGSVDSATYFPRLHFQMSTSTSIGTAMRAIFAPCLTELDKQYVFKFGASGGAAGNVTFDVTFSNGNSVVYPMTAGVVAH